MAVDATRYEIPLHALRRLEPYQPDHYGQLEDAVLEACEAARHYDKDEDPNETGRREDAEALAEIGAQLRAIAKLRGFMRRYPRHAGFALAQVHLADGIEIRSHTRRPLHGLWIEMLDVYADALRHRPVAKRGPWAHRTQVGPLVYPQPVDRHPARVDVPATGLLFQLVLYFRRFTHGIGAFERLQYGEPMPDCGEPCYDVAAEFVNAATGVALGTPSQVRHRLAKLIRENPGIGFGAWPA